MTTEQLPGSGKLPGSVTPAVPWATTLAALSLLWLLATLSSARHTIGDGSTVDALTVARAALALPPVISASLVAGVAVGLAAVTALTRRIPSLARSGQRYLTSGGAGTAVGLAATAPIALGYGGLPSVLVLSGTVTVAAGLGGLLAGVPHRVMIAAGVLGSFGVFLVGFAAGIFDGDLLSLFGAGDTEASVLAANGWVALLASVTAGVVAGALGYTYLRRCGPQEQRWPAYLVAGATPGLLVLLAEAVTRLGGARLFQLVSMVSADETYLRYLSAARLNRALIVLFVGALLAIFLLGRSLTPDKDEPDTEPGQSDESGSR